MFDNLLWTLVWALVADQAAVADSVRHTWKFAYHFSAPRELSAVSVQLSAFSFQRSATASRGFGPAAAVEGSEQSENRLPTAEVDHPPPGRPRTASPTGSHATLNSTSWTLAPEPLLVPRSSFLVPDPLTLNPTPSTLNTQSPINIQHLPRDIAGIGGGEEYEGVGHLLRLYETAQRNLLHVHVPELGIGEEDLAHARVG